MEEGDFQNLLDIFRTLKKWRDEAEIELLTSEESQIAALQ